MDHACVSRVRHPACLAAALIAVTGGCSGSIGQPAEALGPDAAAAVQAPSPDRQPSLSDAAPQARDASTASGPSGPSSEPKAPSPLPPINATGGSFTSDADLDTASCSNKADLAGEIKTDASGGKLCVFAFEELRIAKGATVRVSGPHPVVFLVKGAVAIEGVLDAGGRGPVPGPGGGGGGTTEKGPGVPGAGPGAGQVCQCNEHDDDDCGGGGGGFGAPGAAGGPELVEGCINKRGMGSPGGPAYGNAELVPLMGGSGGATAGQIVGSPFAGAFGGGGGGALQISSHTEIVIDGAITAGGGGGRYSGPLAGDRGGGGGGSGGGILLEAPVIRGAGLVAVNGGGGASGVGDERSCTLFEHGQDGTASREPAAGGKGDKRCMFGGNGGTGTTPPVPGAKAGQPGAAGGGGGAAGLIRFNWRGHSATPPVAASGHVSTGELASP